MKNNQFKRLLKDRSGNFGIMTAIMLPVLLGVAGIAIDVTRALDEKSRIQAMADAATLAVASAMADKGNMSEQEAESLGLSTFVSQTLGSEDDMTAEQRAELEKQLRDATAFEAKTTSTHNSDSYDVRMTSTYNVPMNGMSAVVGFKTLKVAVESRASSGREGNALSMYLVLDESGSMAWDTSTVDPLNPNKKIKKMASLKAAAGVMFNELEAADPTGKLIRIGGDSYDDKTKNEQEIKWGTSDIKQYVKNLPDQPDGGTDASGAMKNAVKALRQSNKTEAEAHQAQGHAKFERFIVLMTDGEMTGNSGVWNENYDNKVRRECEDAKADGATNAAKDDGIKIYTIAFMAPTKGRQLLEYCSSGQGYYYEPSNMTQLVQAFGEIARKAAKTGTRLTN